MYLYFEVITKMNEKDLANWENLESSSSGETIEKLMLQEVEKIYNKTPKVGIPTRYFKDKYEEIFKRKSTNPQPRLNKAMTNLGKNNLVQIKKVSGRNYIRFLPVQQRTDNRCQHQA